MQALSPSKFTHKGSNVDQQLTRIDEKLDKIVDRLGSIDSTLAVQAASLTEHMRRTNALETRVEQVYGYVQRAKGAAAFIGFAIVIIEAIRNWG